jgi:CO/xanthine dehydrogenase FAD-binding subunit
MTFGLSGIPAFDYYRPANLADALILRQAQPQALVYLGGSDVFPRLRSRQLSSSALIDLKSIADFPATEVLADGTLRINPQESFIQLLPWLANFPGGAVLSAAIQQTGTPALRNHATLAGNICNASPSADSLAPLMVLQTQVILQSLLGSRQLPVQEFILGPGKTACRPDELLTQINIPVQPEGSVGTYLKLGRNKAADLAICGAAVMSFPAAGTANGLRHRIAVSGANPVPLLLENISEYLASQPAGLPAYEHAARLAADAVHPIDDLRSSKQYRTAMVYELVLRGLIACHEQLEDYTQG